MSLGTVVGYQCLLVMVGTLRMVVTLSGHNYSCLTRPRGYKSFSCSTQLRMKFVMLIKKVL